MTSKYLSSWAAVLLLVGVGSFFGYEITKPSEGGLPSIPYDPSTPISVGHGQWDILQQALTLLEQAANACAQEGAAPSQDPTPEQEVVSKLKSMAADDRIDLGRNVGRKQGDKANSHPLAATVTISAYYAAQHGINVNPVYHGKGPGGTLIAPGINLMPDAFPAGPGTPGDVAFLAAILFHEGVHAKEMHGNTGNVTDADEREAYEKENAMICCMISFLESSKPEGWEEMKDALCVRTWVIQAIYVCKFGGDLNNLPDCACPTPPWVFWICGTFSSPSAPSLVLPRDPIAASGMNIMSVSNRNSLGVFTASLFPDTKALLVARYGQASGGWNLDLSSQTEGDFQPLCMIGDSGGGMYICGRLAGSTNAVIYHCTFSWSNNQPVLQSSLVLNGGGIGDITAVANITELNGKLAVFDFTNAAIKYVDVNSGAVTTLVDTSGGHGDLLQVRGMIADFVKEDAGLGTAAAVWFTLQSEQEINLLGENIFWLNVIDFGFDGTMDHFFTD